MGVLVRDMPGMSPETKNQIRHEEIERTLNRFARELRELREIVHALEGKK